MEIAEAVEYLLVIFLIIIIVGFLANRELARDKQGRVKDLIREYSFRTYTPEDKEKNPQKETEEKHKEG